MAKLNDLIVTIGARTREFDKKLGQSIRKLQRFGSTTKRIGKNMTQAITMPIIGIGAAALKSAADLEAMEASFVSLTGGAKGAADMMANLNQFAAKTPFQIEDIANSARQLLASGTDISQVNEQLQYLGDIAATSGSPINEIAAIFAKVNAKGKVELESLNQLAERGVGIFTALSDATGLPADKLGAGAVSVEQFNAVLKSMSEEGGFAAGAMQRLSETASGKFSTALDNLKQAGAAMAQSFLPIVKEALDRFTSFAKRVTSLSAENKKLILTIAGIAAALGPVIFLLPTLVQGFMAIISPIGLVILAVGAMATAIYKFRSEVSKPIADVINFFIRLYNESETLRVAIAGVGYFFVAAFKAAKAQVLALFNTFGALAKTIHVAFTDGIGAAFSTFQEEMGGIAQDVKDAGEDIYSGFKDAIDQAKAKDPIEFVTPEDIESSIGTGFGFTKLFGGGGAAAGGPADMATMTPQTGATNAVAQGLMGVDTYAKRAEQSTKAYNAALTESAQITENLNAKNEALQNSYLAMANKLSGTFSSLFSGLLAGTQTFGEFMKKTITDLLIKLASMVAAFAVLNVLTGGAGTVGGQTLKQFLGGGFGLPMMAEGGIVSGKTALIAGEYAGAKSNPEVIAPLDKLQSLLGGAGGQVQVYGTLSGKDILLSSERAGIDRNRVRGF